MYEEDIYLIICFDRLKAGVKNKQTNFPKTPTKVSNGVIIIYPILYIYGPQGFSEPNVPQHQFTPVPRIFQNRHRENCKASKDKERDSEISLVNDPENMQIFKGL